MAARLGAGLVYACALVLLVASVLLATSGLVGLAIALVVVIGLTTLLTIGFERTAFALLVLAFATAPMYRGLAGLTGNVSTPTDLLVVMAAALLVPVVISRPLRLPPHYLLGLLLVMVSGLVASLLSTSASSSVFSLVRWMVFLAVLPIVLAWWRPEVWRVVTLLWAYLAGHAVSTAYALASGPTVGDRYQGLTHHTNAFGMAGLASIAIIIYLFAHHRTTPVRVLLLAAGAVSVASIIMSGSRSALVVAAVLVVLVPVFERSAVMGFVVTITGVLALTLAPLVIHGGHAGSAITRLTGDGTAVVADQARSAALDEGLRRFWESPILGSGLNDVEFFHNIFLEVVVGAGIFGLLGYLIVLAVLTRPLLTDHVHRRLCYLPLAFIGLSPALPDIWDETMWVAIGLAILATLTWDESPAAAPGETRFGPGRLTLAGSAPRARARSGISGSAA